jgi:ABC-type phosphate/phosphonate transport system substrate-binding protein
VNRSLCVESRRMIASLMMYARPELEEANARFWTLIRAELHAQGIDSPEHLSNDANAFDVWENPDLIVSQTCGMPYRIWLKDKVQLVGTPDYGMQDCPAGYYRSPLVVRTDDPCVDLADLKGARLAYNARHSQSGFASVHAHAAASGFWFENQLETGSHNRSAAAVADSRADIAALDGVTWGLIQRFESFANKLRVLEWTAPTPALPLITSLDQDPDAIFTAVSNAIDALTSDDKTALGIKSLIKIPKDAYVAVPNPPHTDLRHPNEKA